MTARHSAKAAERLCLKRSRLTRWRSWLKGLGMVAGADLRFWIVPILRNFSIARSRGLNGWCEVSALLFFQPPDSGRTS